MIPKYKLIYQDIKENIQSGKYPQNEFLPSENELTKTYHCSRNTLRNALSILATEGVIQPIHGKGVRVIFPPEVEHPNFIYHGIGQFDEALEEDEVALKKFVNVFSELYINEEISKLTTFPINTPIYYVERVRYMDEKPVILHRSYFRQDIAVGLTKRISEASIYNYLKEELKQTIGVTKRTIFVEKATKLDSDLLELEEYDCVVVVVNRTYNGEGIMFEFTESRHNPAYFVYSD
ncbi:GntR family transcriptional regulator [Enterococcus sp. DIV0086]|uniref:GntR family transcriptional regulator n=1 Tax=Enterococcus sp. DIV0086 TaxID=2774655 RepID=UPI003D275C7A